MSMPSSPRTIHTPMAMEKKDTLYTDYKRRMSLPRHVAFEEERPKQRRIDKETTEGDILSSIFPDWYQSQKAKSRVFWSCVLLIATGLLIYHLIVTYQEFKTNPILTTYSLVAAHKDGMSFPDVYICPMTPFHALQKWRINTSSKWEDENEVFRIFSAKDISDSESSILKVKQTKWEEINNNIGHTNPVYEEQDCSGHPSTYQKIYREAMYTPTSLDDYFKKVGYPVDALFKECSFGGISKNCSSIAKKILDRDHGLCYVIEMKQSQLVASQGLSLVLNVDREYAYTDHPPLFDGAQVRVEHKFDPAGAEFINLYPGTYTKLSLQATQFSLVQKIRPFGGEQRCTQPDEGRANLRVLKGVYSLALCQMDCVQWVIKEECDCIMPIHKEFLSKKLQWPQDYICSYQKQQNCAHPALSNATQLVQLHKCYEKCHVPCSYWDYETSLSFSKFPSLCLLNDPALCGHNNQKTLNTNAQITPETNVQQTTAVPKIDEDDLYYYDFESRKKREISDPIYADFEDEIRAEETKKRKKRSVSDNRISWQTDNPNIACRYESTQNWFDYIILDIGFSKMQFTKITQENSMTFTSFVSAIGGQMGLWIGASMIAIVKFCATAVPTVWSVIKSRAEETLTN